MLNHCYSGGLVTLSILCGNLLGILYQYFSVDFLPMVALVAGGIFGIVAAQNHPRSQAIVYFLACLLLGLLGGANGEA